MKNLFGIFESDYFNVSLYDRSLLKYTCILNIFMVLICSVVLITGYVHSTVIPDIYVRFSFLAICLLFNQIFLVTRKLLLYKINTLAIPFFFIFIFPILFRHIHEGMFLWFPFGLIIIGATSFIVFSWQKEKVILHMVFMIFIFTSIFIDKLMREYAGDNLDLSFIYNSNYIYYQLSKILLSLFLYITLYFFKYYSYKDHVKLDYLNKSLAHLNKNLEAIIDERTHRLKYQNEKLKMLTYSNSHRIRACVARILGLIYLTEDNADNEDKDFYLKKIKEAAGEIEQETGRISVLLSEENIDKEML